jgi:hypothetical protein
MHVPEEDVPDIAVACENFGKLLLLSQCQCVHCRQG